MLNFRKRAWVISLFSFLLTNVCHANISVIDDLNSQVTLKAPAQRIVSLAPHVTELLFSAGAGDRVVGVVSYSNYPEAAKQIKNVGSLNEFDFEAVVSLKPDLVVSWQSGNSDAHIEKLKKLGLTVFTSEPRSLENIARNLEKLAKLVGTQKQTEIVVKEFRDEVSLLKKQYSNKKPVGVFYQVWHTPLITLNGKHLFSDVLKLCGGRNVFADLPALAPHISIEAVLKEDPDVIIASGMAESRPDWLDDWLKWEQLSAVKNKHLYFIPPDLIQRHTVRILQGAKMMCQQLDRARK